MGKVITNKIVIINKDEPVIVPSPQKPVEAAEESVEPADAMHFGEEMVLVFDDHGNCVGKVSHEKVSGPV